MPHQKDNYHNASAWRLRKLRAATAQKVTATLGTLALVALLFLYIIVSAIERRINN